MNKYPLRLAPSGHVSTSNSSHVNMMFCGDPPLQDPLALVTLWAQSSSPLVLIVYPKRDQATPIDLGRPLGGPLSCTRDTVESKTMDREIGRTICLRFELSARYGKIRRSGHSRQRTPVIVGPTSLGWIQLWVTVFWGVRYFCSLFGQRRAQAKGVKDQSLGYRPNELDFT